MTINSFLCKHFDYGGKGYVTILDVVCGIVAKFVIVAFANIVALKTLATSVNKYKPKIISYPFKRIPPLHFVERLHRQH